MIKSIVFDCDGTLVDTSFMIGIYKKTYLDMFDNKKFKTDKDFMPAYFMTNVGALNHFEVPMRDREEFVRELENNLKLEAKHLKIFSGIENLLNKLAERNIVLGINTSRTNGGWVLMEEVMGTSLYKKFSTVITNEKIKNHKPHPESLLLYLRETKFDKEEVLFIGDSMYDYQCAKSANIKFGVAGWGVLSPYNWGNSIYFSNPTSILNYLKEEEHEQS